MVLDLGWPPQMDCSGGLGEPGAVVPTAPKATEVGRMLRVLVADSPLSRRSMVARNLLLAWVLIRVQ